MVSKAVMVVHCIHQLVSLEHLVEILRMYHFQTSSSGRNYTEKNVKSL